jgi:hypothetical protein
MKKFVTIFGVVLAALALAGVAWALAPQGKLEGEIKWNNPGSRPFEGPGTNGIHTISTEQPTDLPILDGETVYVNKNNDPSGDCNGDSGRITVQYVDANVGSIDYNIICAHYSNSVSMSFDYFDTHYNKYLVVSIVDRSAANKAPIVRFGVETDATRALEWVNLGTAGSGHTTMTEGSASSKNDLSVTQSQT